MSKNTDSYWEDLLVVGGWFVQQIAVDDHDALLHDHREVNALRRDGKTPLNPGRCRKVTENVRVLVHLIAQVQDQAVS